jgi:DNA topoisomerase I
MKLLIVESPSKAKTIGKYLGKDFKVLASVGHVRDLPKSNKSAIDIEAGFVPNYEVVKGKEKVVAEIKSSLKDASDVILATDPDREGEAIAWHIAEACGLRSRKHPKDQQIKRIVFHEITKEAIEEALKHPRKIDQNLKEAQEARRVLDRLVGYELSGLVWKKVRYGLSAGRVQSPALRIIMEREREIRIFNPVTFWIISADLQNKNGEVNRFVASVEPTDKSEVLRIVKEGKDGLWRVEDVKESRISRSPRPPFITSTLQQTASSRLGFAPSRTMRIAQKLYEAGLITYMRTDSTNLGAQAMREIESIIKTKFGDKYFEARRFAKKSKNAQEAHEAIRPTRADIESAGSTSDENKLYRLIWQRTVASQMKSAEIIRTKIVANLYPEVKPMGNQHRGLTYGGFPDFWLNGSRVLFDGWTKADPYAQGDDVILPEFRVGDSLKLLDIVSLEKQTEPPSRYSEAGLIKELEKRGIGRPSTYASIIKTLEDRQYAEKRDRTLFPTDIGEVVSNFLEENFSSYISDSFTAEMEDKLDEIAKGDRTYRKTLEDFYKPFHKDVKSKEKIDKVTNLGIADDRFKCPICNSSMVIKLGKGGKFLSCDRFPDCIGTLTIHGEEIKADVAIGNDPETGLPVYIKIGRFGPYAQLGNDDKKKKIKAKKASIPKDKKINEVTLENALHYLSLPRHLGKHPETGENIYANVGRFGPYIAHETKPKPDFRSLKIDDAYTIELPRALEILGEPKKEKRFKKK